MSIEKPSATQAVEKSAPKAQASAKAVPAPKSSPAKTIAMPKVAKAQQPAETPIKASLEGVVKPIKNKKPKLVRDSLTMPKGEYDVLELLKVRAATLQTHIKKTELIRAGIKSLAAMADAEFLAAIKAVPNLKTGRPKKS